MNTLEGLKFFESNQTGTYTTSTGKGIDLSLEALMKIMADLPDPPVMLRVDIKACQILPKNTILISSDIADVLDGVIEKTDPALLSS
jgi:hypothetical protein